LCDYNLWGNERLKNLKASSHGPFQAGMGGFGCAVRPTICSKISAFLDIYTS
jgi:hypothetical protein